MWVDNMVDNLTYSYLYTKRDVYYFSKHVPKDIRSHYKRDRIMIVILPFQSIPMRRNALIVFDNAN